ncbi:hypothetical protein CHS0354_012878 [Potamilus streckersoni]|uniref:C2 domain-containing protein n=1 Tax=Potamilus streckersoni TaxID=2493646 RepID=A0AAE0SWL8_9BIVA|nr:hypothetical protein CHS0354_012878 [Potamilus streckersoni]
MGSSPSNPAYEPDEKFWVPPNVIERKRAKSLVPTVSRNDSEEEASSGTTTPGSHSGIRNLTHSFPSAPLLHNDGFPTVTSRPRRASMQDAIDFRKLDSKLYDKKYHQRQHSVSSIEEENLGAVKFSIGYNPETHLLTVHVIEARDLHSRDFSGTADPYCIVSLLPLKRTLQSKVHRKTINPVFDEEFVFYVLPHSLSSVTVEISMFDYDQLSRFESIGQTRLAIGNIDLDQKHIMWKPLAEVNSTEIENKDLGELIVSLGYLSTAERLTVVVMKARNLQHLEQGKITMDPYVKVIVAYGGKRQKKKKTSTKHNTTSPVWNEALTFNLAKEHLQNICVDFTVCHDNKIGRDDEVIGRLRISRESEGDEKIHWDEMISCRSAVARWHMLTS